MDWHRLALRRPALAPLVALPVVVIALVGTVGSSPGDNTARGNAPASGGAIEIAGFAFDPLSVRVPAGTKVVWTNRDGARHTVEDAGDLFEESEDLQAGDVFSHTYDVAGTYPYFCGIHQYMRGEIVVTG